MKLAAPSFVVRVVVAIAGAAPPGSRNLRVALNDLASSTYNGFLVGTMLMAFFKRSGHAQCWFVVGGSCS